METIIEWVSIQVQRPEAERLVLLIDSFGDMYLAKTKIFEGKMLYFNANIHESEIKYKIILWAYIESPV